MVWAASLQLLLMSCNREQQEAMPARGNCRCSVHLFSNRERRQQILGAYFLRTKEAEEDGARGNNRTNL